MAAGDQRIWVSEDRCVLVTLWPQPIDVSSFGLDMVIPYNVTVATREHPSHTWGPPVTLIEEK